MTKKTGIILVWFGGLNLMTAGTFYSARAQQSSPASDNPPVHNNQNQLLCSGAILQVNDGAITSTEVLTPLQDQLREWATNMTRSQFLTKARAVLVENTMISLRNMLLYQHAKSVLEKNENYETALKAQIAAKRKEIITSFGGSEARAQEELAQRGTSIEQEMDILERSLVTSAYQQTYFFPSLEITRSQLMQYYRTYQKEKYYQKAAIQFQLIEIHINKFLPDSNDSDITDDVIDQARAAAEASARQVHQKITGGEDFTTLVRQYSHGFRLANDGLSRLLSPDSLHERYQPVVKALENIALGQYTAVLEGEDCFFIAKLIERRKAQVIPFSEVQNEISELLRHQQWLKHSAKQITQLWNKATIGDIEHFIDESALIAYEQFKPNKSYN